jgi:hypothetical protein
MFTRRYSFKQHSFWMKHWFGYKTLLNYADTLRLRRIAMTIAEILQQAKTLSGQERKELVKLLVDSRDVPEAALVSSGVYLNYAG